MRHSIPISFDLRKHFRQALAACLACGALILAQGYSAKAEPDNRPLSFVTKGHLLPRRGHQTIEVRTLNLDAVDVSITFTGEADALSILKSNGGMMPEDGREIWHGQVKTVSASGTGAPQPNQPGLASIDVLHLVPALQPGIYRVTAAAGPFGQIATWFTISNLGIEALTGSDGIEAQIRLLSEASPAQNVEVALVSGNNRELARVRSDADGVARFPGTLAPGKGQDAPAALYAYGADGEFTALPLFGAPTLFQGAQDRNPAFPAAWIETDRARYDPGDRIHGMALARKADGHDVAQPLYAQLRGPNGDLTDEQKLEQQPGGFAAFTLHAPPETGATWTIDIVDRAKHVFGSSTIETGAGGPANAATAAADAQPPQIVISPGRRTFQPGETANISVQPPVDADVTLAVLDTSVHAIVRQHIAKDGSVVQIPIPADAGGGVYVLATAFTPPDEAAGRPMQRSFGLQWLDIDQGNKRMGVRLDTPESAAAGSSIPVKVNLPDLGGKIGSFAVIGSDADTEGRPDPIGYFYGRQPIGVEAWDNYADVIGGDAQPAIPDFGPVISRPKPPALSALVWNGPSPVTGGDAVASVDMPNTKTPDRIRLSVIAASDDRIGVAETGIILTAAAARKPEKAKPVPVARAKPATIAPHASLSLRAGQAAYISTLPVVAAPLWIDGKGVPHFESPADPDTLALIRAAPDRPDIEQLSYWQLLAHDTALPSETKALLHQALLDMTVKGTPSDDQKLLAIYALYHGQDRPLWVEAWLPGAKPESHLARLCRFALLNDDEDFKTLSDDDTDDDDDTTHRIMKVLITQQIAASLPRSIPPATDDLAALSALAFGDHDLFWQDRLGLRLIEIQAHAGAGNGVPKLAGKAAGDGQAVIAGPGKIASADKRAIYAVVLSNWPAQAPQ